MDESSVPTNPACSDTDSFVIHGMGLVGTYGYLFYLMMLPLL